MKKPHIAIIGAGAVGGYVGGHLARAGEDVTLIDPWVDHIETIKAGGVRISGTQGNHVVRVNALHISEVQHLLRKPVDVAIIATKSFDTLWVAQMIRDYLSTDGFLVSMQNSINEESIASVVGWGRTLGCVLNTIGVSTVGPGHLTRHRIPGGGKSAVFRIGEVHGRTTPRATALASMLEAVDSAMVTSNLWGERWGKLVTNAMQMGLLGATGLTNEEIVNWTHSRALLIRAAAEGIAVGRAQGFDIAPIINVSLDDWLKAANNDASALHEVEEGLFAYLNRQTESGRRGHGSLGRDVLAGRRSEIDFLNGLIATKGEQIGIAAPVHRALTKIVKRIERGELTPARENILALEI